MCAVLCMTVLHNDMHSHMRTVLKFVVGLGLDFVFVCFLRFIILSVSFCVGLDCFCCVGFSFFSTKLRDWLGRTTLK